MFPCPPLLLLFVLLLERACALSLKLSRADKLRDTAIFALLSLAESTLELPNNRPHLLPPRIFGGIVEGGPDEGDGDCEGDGTELIARESSVSVSLAGN